MKQRLREKTAVFRKKQKRQLPSLLASLPAKIVENKGNFSLVRKGGRAARIDMDIERLVQWAYVDQRASGGDDAVFGPRSGGSAWGGFETLAMLGTFVDTSAVVVTSRDCHRDAELVVEAVSMLPREQRLLVLAYCTRGMRPDWKPYGVGVFRPVLNGKGQPKKIWRDRINRRGNMGSLVWQDGPSWHMVEVARAEYRQWHAALAFLVNILWPKMHDYCPVGPVCAAKPWEKGKQKMRKRAENGDCEKKV